jgi:hypothetical protein
MRKQIINRRTQNASLADERWLNLECPAQTEVTCENPKYPIGW